MPTSRQGSQAMPQFQGGGSGQPLRSASCVGGMHADCGHLGAIARGPQNDGRPSVLRCFCACHSACPLANRVWVIPRAVWQEQCTCPGTEQAARKLDEADTVTPDFAELERKQQERRDRHQRERQERLCSWREFAGAPASRHYHRLVPLFSNPVGIGQEMWNYWAWPKANRSEEHTS